MTTASASAKTAARHLEDVAADVARLAADYVRARSGDVATKGTKSTPTDVVTETDVQCEMLIRRELTARVPGSTIAGEELDELTGTNSIGWIVDPIDGTVNYLYDLPVVAVSIAATMNGRVVAGAVADVHRGDIFSATTGEGARRCDDPIAVSDNHDLGLALVGTGFAYDADLRSAQSRILTHVLPACRDIRCMGSAALNLCWVACGRLDAYFEGDLKTYDYAAGALIAAEGGASVELPVDNDFDLTISASPGVFSSLRRLVAVGPDR